MAKTTSPHFGAKAPIRSAEDESTKSLLNRVGHGQLYVPSQVKATGQALERGADIVFRKEASAQHCDIYKM